MGYRESFFDYMKYEKRSSSHTVVAYKIDLDQFVQFCTEMIGEFDVKKVDAKLIRSWIVRLMEDQMSARSVNRKITSVKSFYNYLLKQQIVEINPAINLALPKIRKKLPNFVEEKNLHHLLDDGFFSDDFAGVRDKLVITLLYGTGIRLSELLLLKDDDFDTKNGLIRVLGKRKKERIIPYPISINQLIEHYIYARNTTIGFKTDRLLVTEAGKPVYEKLIYRVVKNNLSKVTSLEKKSPHVLRHTYATHLLNKGADLNAVKELLGHANLAATQIYTHTTFERLHDIYKQAHPRG
ncbi:MAG TPA: tyrosine-type recombinase/integrase [Draconibacterium sp.]|nr:tyrosine-type recombinase/integrase [Draconibacterium sp.]